MKALFVAKSISLPVLAIVSICLSTLTPSMAQGPAGDPASTSQPPPIGEVRVEEILWEKLGYDDRKLTSSVQAISSYFHVPGDLVFVPGSYAIFVVSHTGDSAGKPATLTVELNGHVLDTVQLTAENDSRGQIRLDMSPEYLKTGSNRLKFVLTAAGNPCYGTDDLPVEVLLHGEGLLHLEYVVVPRDPDLALYPVPFVERGFEPSVVCFVLPDSPSSDDLTTAATISAGLGRYSEGEVQIHSVTPSELTLEVLDSCHLIVLGRLETNSLFSQLSLPMSLEQADIGDEYGILQEASSPWNPRRMVLVVTGKTQAGVSKAGAALNRPISFPGFKGPIAVVEELLESPLDEVVETLAVDRTFEDLGYEDTVIYGTRPDSEPFFFYLPESWQMSEAPSLSLFFTHSEALGDKISTLDVRLNKVPVGSALLDQTNSQEGLLEVELPSWLLGGGRNVVEVAVNMDLGTDECVYWTSRQVWTVISRNSTFHLSYEPQAVALDLAHLFRPLTYEPDLGDTCVALPEVLTTAERDAFLNLAAQLGAAARGKHISLHAYQANDFGSTLRQACHIVAFGQPSSNSLIREVNDVLPQPFVPGGDEPSQVHNAAIISLDPQRSIGFVQLAVSPWSPDKTLLVVTGTDSEGVLAAFDLLLNSAGKLKGDLAIIEDENLVTIDTRLLTASQGAGPIRVVRPDTSVLMAQAERWW